MTREADPRESPPASHARPINPPIKRHPTLQPLSREHFGGLLLVRRLREAAGAGDEAARLHAAELLAAAWAAEIEAHFADEELLVGPFISDQDKARLIEEHRSLERRIAMINHEHTAPSPAWLDETATLLEQHIRWEERELFPAAEKGGADCLDTLAHEAERIERDRPGARRRQKPEAN